MIHDTHFTWYTMHAHTGTWVLLYEFICMYKEVSHEVQQTTDDTYIYKRWHIHLQKYCLGYTFVK